MNPSAPRQPARKSRARRPIGTGIVSHWVQGSTGGRAAAAFAPIRLNVLLRAGLPVRELQELQASLDVPMENGKLDPAESDRVVRFARLMGKAVEVMESGDHARKWLNSPQVGLGGEVPLEFAETEAGAREVEDLLNRIEFGVYS